MDVIQEFLRNKSNNLSEFWGKREKDKYNTRIRYGDVEETHKFLNGTIIFNYPNTKEHKDIVEDSRSKISIAEKLWPKILKFILKTYDQKEYMGEYLREVFPNKNEFKKHMIPKRIELYRGINNSPKKYYGFKLEVGDKFTDEVSGGHIFYVVVDEKNRIENEFHFEG